MRIKIASLIFTLAILLSSSNNTLANNDIASPLLLASATQSQDESIKAANDIDNLTRQIIIKVIELEKFNWHYRIEVGKQGRWAGWRYATLQEANFLTNLGSEIYSIGERTSHFKDPEKISLVKLERCNITCMIGYIIGAAAGALELGITEFHDIQASQKGFSPKAAKSYVLSLKNEIDKLFLEREALLKIEAAAPLLPHLVQEDLIEGKVLMDLRDLALLEFQDFHIHGRRCVAFQKSLYFLDMTKYTCSALGSFFAYMTEHRHDRKFNLSAGILYDISGSLIIATPYVSRGIGILVQKIQKHYISPITQGIHTKQIATLEADEVALDKLGQEKTADVIFTNEPLKRMTIYKKENLYFESEAKREVEKERAGKLTATQNMFTGTVTGGCHLADGILYTSAGTIANKETPRDSSITNYNLGTAAIINLSGNSLAILDTLRIQVQAEINRHKAQKAGKLPSQIFTANLAKLDQIEQQISK